MWASAGAYVAVTGGAPGLEQVEAATRCSTHRLAPLHVSPPCPRHCWSLLPHVSLSVVLGWPSSSSPGTGEVSFISSRIPAGELIPSPGFELQQDARCCKGCHERSSPQVTPAVLPRDWGCNPRGHCQELCKPRSTHRPVHRGCHVRSLVAS